MAVIATPMTVTTVMTQVYEMTGMTAITRVKHTACAIVAPTVDIIPTIGTGTLYIRQGTEAITIAIADTTITRTTVGINTELIHAVIQVFCDRTFNQIYFFFWHLSMVQHQLA